MRSMKEIMEEMGFNKDAPLESQKAFVKHLIAAANAADNRQKFPQTLSQKNKVEAAVKTNTKQEDRQLSFDLPEDKRVS
jgi:uncharacterized protein YaeQ